MNKQVKESIEILSRTPNVLKTLLFGLSDPYIKTNEGQDTWSPYDVVGHLIHGERTDWIPRMDKILYEDDKTFVPFDRFAQFATSQGKNISELLDEFEKLRKDNIAKLLAYDLSEEDMHLTGIHPELGSASLSQLLSAWVVHDLGHIVQVSRVMAKRFKMEVGPWTKYLTVLN